MTKQSQRGEKGVSWVQIAIIAVLILPSILISIPIVSSQPTRNAYLSFVRRQIAKIVRPRLVFAGDSLTANASWGWVFTGNPLYVVNLAEPGASIEEVGHQVTSARVYRAQILLVLAGTIDIVQNHRTVDQIVCSFTSLLDKVPASQRLIVTLIPYTSFPYDTEQIRAANVEIRKLSERRGADLIDINPEIATDGVLRTEFTRDGIHLTERGYQVWTGEISKHLKF